MVVMVSPFPTCKPFNCSLTASMMAIVLLLMPFEPAEMISPLSVVDITIFVTGLFNAPFGDGVAAVTGLLIGVNFFVAVAFAVRVVVANVDAGRFDVVVVVVVVDEIPPPVDVRVVLVFVSTFDTGLCSMGKKTKIDQLV